MTREIRNKKAADAAALQKAMQVAREIEIPAFSRLREDVGVSAQKVIEVAEEVQELASVEVGNLLKMSTEIQRVEASGIEEQASDAATEDHQGKDSIHNASENITDAELSLLLSSTYTSPTPSPSNLNSSGEYVPMVPSVQERIDNLIQRHIDVGQRLPEGHWGRPDVLKPIQSIAPDSDIPTTSTSTKPQPSTQTCEPNLEKASELASDEITLESPQQQEPNSEMATDTCTELVIHPEYHPYHLNATHSNISFGIALRNISKKRSPFHEQSVSDQHFSRLEE